MDIDKGKAGLRLKNLNSNYIVQVQEADKLRAAQYAKLKGKTDRQMLEELFLASISLSEAKVVGAPTSYYTLLNKLDVVIQDVIVYLDMHREGMK